MTAGRRDSGLTKAVALFGRQLPLREPDALVSDRKEIGRAAAECADEAPDRPVALARDDRRRPELGGGERRLGTPQVLTESPVGDQPEAGRGGAGRDDPAAVGANCAYRQAAEVALENVQEPAGAHIPQARVVIAARRHEHRAIGRERDGVDPVRMPR